FTAWTGPFRPGYCLRNSLTRIAHSAIPKRLPVPLDHGSVRQDGRFGDDDHPVPDHVRGMLLRLLDTARVDDPDVAADAGVLVDDRPLDHRVRAHAHGWAAEP